MQAVVAGEFDFVQPTLALRRRVDEGGHIGVSLSHLALHFDGATHRVDEAGELDEQAISRCFDDATVMFLNFGVG